MIKILYIRDSHGKNHATVAYDISDRQSGSVKFAAASCSSVDSFSKSVGIDIATSRLSSSPTILVVKADAPNSQVVRAILKKISRSDNILSVSARKLCKKMLRRYEEDSICGGCFC